VAVQPGGAGRAPACPAVDPETAHRRELQRSDEVLQQLVVTKYALTIGDMPRAMAAIDAALRTARCSLNDLLVQLKPSDSAESGYAGTMVREVAAGSRPPRMQAASPVPPVQRTAPEAQSSRDDYPLLPAAPQP
jgi:hypothetical protein